MDSSNSGSFQSSSGGGGGGGPDNDEYDSRSQSISSFFNPPTNFNTNFNPNINQLLQPPPPPAAAPSSSSYPNHHRPSATDNTFYNPSSFSTLQQPGSAWTAPIPPDQTLADLGSYPINPNPASGRGSDHQRHPIGVTVKNPKKRTRASRRAPTTVLTTDTTNFRQMVQEFTGIPSAPFSTASFSRRLDLFGRGSDGGGGSLQALRPSAAAKAQAQAQAQAPAPPFLNSPANIVESGTSNNSTPAATTSGNYQFAPSAVTDFQKQPSTFLDLQNPMFSFQSLLQNTLPQQSNDLNGSSKRYGKLETFQGVIRNSENIGGSKLNSGLENVLVSSRTRSGGDQVQGNEGSWICPSN